MSKPDPTRYRTTNWKSYNEAAQVAADLARQGHGVAGCGWRARRVAWVDRRVQRHLISRRTLKTLRDRASADWREIVAA